MQIEEVLCCVVKEIFEELLMLLWVDQLGIFVGEIEFEEYLECFKECVGVCSEEEFCQVLVGQGLIVEEFCDLQLCMFIVQWVMF